MKRTIIFYDPNRKNQRDALRILAATGLRIEAPSSIPNLEQAITKIDPTLLILDLEGHKYLSEAGLMPEGVQSIIMSKAGLETIHPYLSTMSGFTNFIAKDRHDRFSNRDLLCTVVKILRNDIFGIKKYLSWGAFTTEYYVRDSSRRHEYLDCLQDYATNMRMRRSVTEAIQVIGEEFLMNAIYDAPTDQGSGQHLFNLLDRKNQVVLPPDQAIRLSFGIDGKRVVVGVTDPFGSITKDKVIQYLAKCFEERQKTNLGQDKETAGAGLGLYFCFKHVNSLIINVLPGHQTEFIGIVEIDGSIKESNKQKTNFHFFTTDNQAIEFQKFDLRTRKFG
ncbi:MAG: hypothetical protein HRU19_17470 [Pseudobacteriovorax sp.]|nr:hypothetical protein [Pseudobacteriovorax sp.]